MSTPLWKPLLLKKGDGSLHLQLSLGGLQAEVPIPEKYLDPTSLGWDNFYNLAVNEMMKGLKHLHKENEHIKKMERKRRNGFKNKRADNPRTPKENDGATTAPTYPRGIRGVE